MGAGPTAAAAWRLGAVLACVAATGPARAGPIAADDPRLQAPAELAVSIPGVAPGAPLPANYTAVGRNLSPPLAWTGGTPGAAGFAVVMQDADPGPRFGAVHWLAYAIPPGLSALPRGLKNLAAPHTPLGVLQGRNDHGSYGYSGPRPPAGEAPHRYRIQLFELGAPLRLKPGADLPALERAMAGRVRGRGELVVTDTPPPAGRAAPPGVPSLPAAGDPG